MKGTRTVPVRNFMSNLFKKVANNNNHDGCGVFDSVKAHIKEECEEPESAVKQALAS